MATKLQIANRALLFLGGTPITDLGDTNNNSARILNAAVDASIEEVLELGDWAINRKTAASTGTTSGLPDSQYTYLHDLTALGSFVNRIRLLTDVDGYRITDYRREGTDLYADEETIYVRYSHPVADPVSFPAYLVSLCVAHLAKMVAIPITGSEDRQGRASEEFERMLTRARVASAREEPPQTYMTDAQSRFVQAHDNHSEDAIDLGADGALSPSPYSP